MAELTTRRLLLRPLCLGDAPAISALLNGDKEAIRMTERLPDPCTIEAAKAWISLRIRPGDQVFAVLEQGGTFVGGIGFARAGDEAALGYWFGRAFWSRGYATEAVAALLLHAQRQGVRRMEAEVFMDNPASSRVLIKNGFAEVGTITKDSIPTREGPQVVRKFILGLC
jgi:RimJ/RimL family protein N-acetyltransferase